MAPVNNVEQRAARKIAASEGIKYTEALRRVRNSTLQPSDILKNDFPVVSHSLEDGSNSLVTDSEFSFDDCLRDYSYNGRYAVRTAFGETPAEHNHKVRLNHLSIVDAVGASKSDLLAQLLKPVADMPTRVIAWDAGGGLSQQMEGVLTDITEFHQELSTLFSGRDDEPVIVAVDGVDSLLSGKNTGDALLAPIHDEVARMLMSVLREGRTANVSLYVTSKMVPQFSTTDFGVHLRNASELVMIGAMPLKLHYSQEAIDALPELTKGWLVMSSDDSIWQVRVPKN